ncbi:hypothetical protein ES703_36206 [subsurface metagenome]
MIIVFPGSNGECSISYRPDLLSDEVKERGIALDKLPVPDKIEGKRAVLMANKETSKVWYEYRDIPPDPLEDRVKQLEDKVSGLEASAGII